MNCSIRGSAAVFIKYVVIDYTQPGQQTLSASVYICYVGQHIQLLKSICCNTHTWDCMLLDKRSFQEDHRMESETENVSIISSRRVS